MSNSSVSNWNVLIVDDDADNLSVLAMLFLFYDATVTSTQSGQEALQELADRKFNVALVDLQMPTVSGWDIIRHIRTSQDPELRSMTVIAVTAQAMQETKARVMAAGFDDYVLKPIDIAAFIQTVQEAVQKRSAPSTPAQTSAPEPTLTLSSESTLISAPTPISDSTSQHSSLPTTDTGSSTAQPLPTIGENK